jgi:predicted transcriptional regulator of viral defense system
MSSENKELQLLKVASEQAGYFTAKQATTAGYSHALQSYHAQTGQWMRVRFGIYRLRDFPPQPREDLAVLTLLSSNKAGVPQAVVSHETALTVYDISDANPARIHMTVPPGFRNHMPQETILHHATLTDQDWVHRDGYRVTTPLRTILDIASSRTGWPHLEAAVRDALDAGLVRKKHLLEAEGHAEMRARLRRAIAAAERATPPSGVVQMPLVPDWTTQANATAVIGMSGITVTPQTESSSAETTVTTRTTTRAGGSD